MGPRAQKDAGFIPVNITDQKSEIIYSIGIHIRKKNQHMGKQTDGEAISQYSLVYAWARRLACVHKQTHVPITYYGRE